MENTKRFKTKVVGSSRLDNKRQYKNPRRPIQEEEI